MKKILILCLAAVSVAGARAQKTHGRIPVYKDASRPVEERVGDLLSRMTLEEKVMQLNQYTLGRNDNANNMADPVNDIPAEIGSLIYYGSSPELRNRVQRKAVEESRLGIPILFGHDVIHGFRTTYPISLAQACSWNPALVEKAAGVAAQEARMSGVDWTFSPMIDVARDPRWGRVAEGYGEDPYANAVFGAATVKGYQGDDLSDDRHVAACLKHFAGYGASEAGRDYVYTEISRQTLWDTYLPPYEAGIKAGAATVMSSFNDISGTPGSANRYLMTEVLKERWGHDGFVVSDWGAIQQLRSQGVAADKKEAAEKAFVAGLEMDMMNRCYDAHLAELVREGRVSQAQLDDAVRRVLRVKFRLGLFERPYTPDRRGAGRGVDGAVEERRRRAAAERRPPDRGRRSHCQKPLSPAGIVVLEGRCGGRGERLRGTGSGIRGQSGTALCPGLQLRRGGCFRLRGGRRCGVRRRRGGALSGREAGLER